ncbi:MAG: type II secretion system F family protein [Candidatus Omnitrophica bacterium]|nr:type II secretion system F family protein [Candidatus Omnitrophota bacterium]
MPIFKYSAKNDQGQTVTETIEARDESVALDMLRAQNLIIINISEEKRATKAAQSRGAKVQGKTVKPEELVLFSRQLATMVNAGIPLVQSLDILSEQMESPVFRGIVGQVRSDVESGSSLSGALEKHPKVFSLLYANMVKAGETSGMLDEILERLAGYLEKSDSLQRKVKSAMVYPGVVTAMAIGITLILMLKVIPTFKEIFNTLGGALPPPTQFLIMLSDTIREYFIVTVGVLVGFGFLVVKLINTPQGRLNFDRLKLKMPVFGTLFQKVAVARFARTLSTLIKSGVAILGALEIVGKTSGNKVIEIAVDKARAGIREGESIADPLSKSDAFPPMVTRMIAVGEESGELEKMLSKIADFYDDQVDAAVSGLTSLIEPLIIAFLGIVVGGIVIAMFLPIFKITELIG